MIAYLDASVVLRLVLGEPAALRQWPAIERAVSSALARTECLRVMDRLRLQGRTDEEATARRRGLLLETLDAIEVLPLDADILERAGDSFPTALGTLDAIHLASALAARQELDGLIFATHDAALGLAASAVGFEVQGLD